MAMTDNVPLEKWVEEIIRRTIAEHVSSCPVQTRVQRLEVKMGSLIGFMAGSGILGGGVGALFVKIVFGA